MTYQPKNIHIRYYNMQYHRKIISQVTLGLSKKFTIKNTTWKWSYKHRRSLGARPSLPNRSASSDKFVPRRPSFFGLHLIFERKLALRSVKTFFVLVIHYVNCGLPPPPIRNWTPTTLCPPVKSPKSDCELCGLGPPQSKILATPISIL